MQKRMLSALLSLYIAFFSLFGAMTVTADQSQNDQKRVASEYLSENMYSDFEEYYNENCKLPRGFSNTKIGSGHINEDGHRVIAERLFSEIYR